MKRRKLLNHIFSSAQQLQHYPLKVLWLFHDTDVAAPLQASVSVPKRQFKKAVHRNRLKRLMREAYRTYKPTLLEQLPPHQNLAVFILYIGKEEITQAEMNDKMHSLLAKMCKLIA